MMTRAEIAAHPAFADMAADPEYLGALAGAVWLMGDTEATTLP